MSKFAKCSFKCKKNFKLTAGGGKHFNFFALKIIQRKTEKDDACVIVMTALCCVYTARTGFQAGEGRKIIKALMWMYDTRRFKEKGGKYD